MITLHFACYVFVTVSALLETRWQQASRPVTEAETLQKQNNPGLQNTGRGCHQHGSGKVLLNTSCM